MALPLTLDEVARRRLLMVRGVFRTALTESHAPLRSHRRIVALVALDLANETILKTVAALDDDVKPPKRERNFYEWITAASSAVAQLSDGSVSTLRGLNPIRAVHRARNAAQHDGWPPSEETLADATRYTRAFLESAVQQVWGRDFSTLSAAEAIETEVCRTQIEEAEKLLAEGKLLDAAQSARTALEWAIARARQWRFPRIPRASMSLPDGTVFSGDLGEEAESLWRAVERLMLGLDDAEQARLTKLTGYPLGLRKQKYQDPDQPIDLAAAEWAVAYCTDVVLTLEQRAGGALKDRFERLAKG